LKRYPAVPRDATHWNWRRKKRVLSGRQIQFIAPSEWVKSQCAKSPVIGENPVHVVPNPIDTNVFKPGDRSAARARFEIPVGAPVVLVAANHLDSQFKGADDAIYVLSKLIDDDVFVLLVGRSSERVAAELRLRSRALGYVDDGAVMADCYRAADVFLMPSRVETFGLVAAEAVACGAVVVSYRAGGLQETTEMADGVVVEDNDRDHLTAVTNRLLASPEERAQRIAKGQPRILKAYSPTAHAESCVRIYREAMVRSI
jgi:glycosyltransferase involved in cell wall biosynthesis